MLDRGHKKKWPSFHISDRSSDIKQKWWFLAVMMVVTCAIPLMSSNRLFFVRQKSVNMRLIVLPSCTDDWMCLPSTEDMLENHQFAIQWHCENQNLELFFQREKKKEKKNPKKTHPKKPQKTKPSPGLNRWWQSLKNTLFIVSGEENRSKRKIFLM